MRRIAKTLVALCALLFAMPLLAQIQLKNPPNLKPPHTDVYSPSAKQAMRIVYEAFQNNSNELKVCLMFKRCNAAEADRWVMQNEVPRLVSLMLACSAWRDNSFSDTMADVDRWQLGPGNMCGNLDMYAGDLQQALPAGSKSHDQLAAMRRRVMTHWPKSIFAKFQNGIVASYEERIRELGHSNDTYETFRLHAEHKLHVALPQIPPLSDNGRARLASLDQAQRGQRAGKPVLRNPPRTAASATARSKPKSTGNAFVDFIYGGMRAFGLPHPDDPNAEKMFMVPGKATFNGIVFGDDAASQIIPAYAKRVESNAQFALGSPTGVKRSWKGGSKDGRVKYHCWEYYPKYRATPTRTTCLYEAGGKIIGGRFPSNEYDKPLIRYVEDQGFTLQTSFGQKQLGFAGRNDFYSMKTMRMNYMLMGMRYNREKIFYESDFCFYPAAYSRSIDKVLRCDIR